MKKTLSEAYCLLTFDNMASMGLLAISYHGTRKVEAGYKTFAYH